MSYDAQENSVEGGQPYTLYLITYGDQPSNYFAYTDIDKIVVKGDIAYLPIPIGREKITESGNLDDKTLKIDISPEAELVKFYRARTPSSVVQMTIWQGHYTDVSDEVQVVWKGRVLSVEDGPRFARINGEPLATVMKRSGLRRYYQRGCPFVLYETKSCKADKEAHKVTLNPLDVGLNFVDIDANFAGAILPAKYAGGYIQWSHDDDGALETKTILSTPLSGSNRRLILNGRVSGLSVTSSISIYVGCNHRRGDCGDLHDNLLNYGGQPFIPRQNPLGFVNRYY